MSFNTDSWEELYSDGNLINTQGVGLWPEIIE